MEGAQGDATACDGVVAQGCPDGGTVAARAGDGTGTEFLYIKGDNVSGHGEYVENMANGDKNHYTYEFTGTMKNGAFVSGSNKWSLSEGGGKMKGGKAKPAKSPAKAKAAKARSAKAARLG